MMMVRALRNRRSYSAVALLIAQMLVTPSFAFDERTYASLRRLDPNMRLEQACDLEAMNRISRDRRLFRPDRAKSNVVSPPEHLGDVLEAPGAAFRSRGKWYALSFVCKASADHLKVISFNYRIGKIIPPSEWAEFALWR